MNSPRAEALVDANILLRYVTDEPRDLADRAGELLQAAENAGISLCVASPTVAEMVYVLESVYLWDHPRIADRLLDFVDAGVAVILEHEVVKQALIWYHNIRGLDFEDAYIAALAMSRRHSTVMSFDKHLPAVPGVVVLSAVVDIQEHHEPD
jgi:predicted nucleic acid-binding protein